MSSIVFRKLKEKIKKKENFGSNTYNLYSLNTSIVKTPIKLAKPAPYSNTEENLLFFLNYNNIEFRNNFLKKYDNFILTNTKNIEGDLRKIGANSANGFNTLIDFKNNYDTNNFKGILKVSKQLSSDNNYYEFYAGKCINKFKEYIPNFVYTFQHLFLSDILKNDISNNYGSNNSYSNKEFFVGNLTYSTINENLNDIASDDKVKSGCSFNNRSGVIIDAVHNSLSWNDLFDTKKSDFIKNLDYNLFCILFQIYAALSTLSNNYTHYDLHPGNILYLYLTKPIKIIYNDKGQEYIIYTKYIPVIIDYGRSYVNCKNIPIEINSADFVNTACDLNECNMYPDGSKKILKNCDLSAKGIIVEKQNNIFTDNNDFFYINPRVRNRSHDLRFLNSLTKLPEVYLTPLFVFINDFFNDSLNPEWELKKTRRGLIIKGYYGVKEFEDNFNKSKSIKTVNDFFNLLKDFYKRTNIFGNNYTDKIHKVDDIYGTINIYTDLRTKWSFS